MALGDSTIVAAQSRSAYLTNNDLIGKAFDTQLTIAKANSNILAQLQGGEGDNKPFIIKNDLTKGAKDTISFNVGAPLGMAGRRGTQRLVGYEEQLLHNVWSVQIDHLRVAVGMNELNRVVATSGGTWMEVYPELCGELVGRTEQEDMLARFRQRSTTSNTIRPNSRASRDTIRYDDTLDTATLGKAVAMANTNGIEPAVLAQGKNGMPIENLVCLMPQLAAEGLWQDPTFFQALLHAEVDGPMNPLWSNNLPLWRGTVMKQWNLKGHDSPGPIMSTIMPQAILGDATDTAGGTLQGATNTIIAGTASTFDIYGGGRAQSSLGDQAALYKPFEYFLGCTKLLGESITTGSDSGTYYIMVLDPADGKWCAYSYVGTAIASNGFYIRITARLHSSVTGVGYTTLKDDGFGGSGTTLWTYDASVNKVAFPAGSLIVQVNNRLVPICDSFLFGRNAGAKAYGMFKNKPISQKNDFEALSAVGVCSTYGCDMRKDANGLYHRNFLRIQSAYELPGYSLPQI